jgi:hypothetical protein
MENLSIAAKAAGPSKTLGQYGTPSTLVAKNLIIYPDVKGIKYEIDLELLTMMQENAFSGEEHEDTNSHLTKVNDICEVVGPRSLPKIFYPSNYFVGQGIPMAASLTKKYYC